MGQTVFSGPVISGDKLAGDSSGFGPNQGNAILFQSTSITQNSTSAVTSELFLPANARIVGFYIDVLTAFNSATSATLSVGITAGGTDYVSGVDVHTAAGRIAPIFTAAQLAAMDGVTLLGAASAVAPPLFVTITPVGATSAGYVQVGILYVQQ